MATYRINQLIVTTRKKGRTRYIKSGSPQCFGPYAEIRTPDYEFQFNLRGEIKSIRGLSMNWPHPLEILKRSDGNDWVYYSVGAVVNQQNIKDYMGEYYLPCPTYSTNTIWNFSPHSDMKVAQGFGAWYQLIGELHSLLQTKISDPVRDLFEKILFHNDNQLHQRTEELHALLGGSVSVLPPDSRHVEYEVIPLMISDGCQYHCGFCKLKSKHRFQARTRDNILQQLYDLKHFYKAHGHFYQGLFLGNHDALNAGKELVCDSAKEAYVHFGWENQAGHDPRLFFFGSVDSLLKTPDGLFDTLNALPYLSYINIGFESTDEETLKVLKKPITVEKVKAAFTKMLDINKAYDRLEVTGNFLIGDSLPQAHVESLSELLQQIPEPESARGTIYLSPLLNSHRSTELLPVFKMIKKQSCLPVYLYLIQRM
ncbi:MAG: radical SAM protein [Proteobacteria bacterium]|nr:radical SAM protein [Pseudomonadota bacterium]